MNSIRLCAEDEGGMTVPVLVPIVKGSDAGIRIEEGVEHEPFFHRLLGANQPEYDPLPCLMSQRGEVVTRWTFTPEERKAIMMGADVFITQLTFGNKLQPLLPLVNEEVGPVLMAVVAARD